MLNPFGGYTVTNPFGAPGPYASGYHTGEDFAMNVGTPVSVVDDGAVTGAEDRGDGFGLMVRVQHAWGETWYAHLSQAAVSVGQAVSAGQLIGYSGNSGMSTGPHLHFQVNINGQPVDPVPYLAGGGAPVQTPPPSQAPSQTGTIGPVEVAALTVIGALFVRALWQ